MAAPNEHSWANRFPRVTNPQELVRGLRLLYDDVRDFEAEKIPSDPGFWWKFSHLNPALYRGFVMATLAILGGFGLVISEHNAEAIVAGVTALMFLVQALWTRKSVTANSKVVVYKPDPVGEPAVVRPGNAVSSNAVAVVNAAATTPTLDFPPLLETK